MLEIPVERRLPTTGRADTKSRLERRNDATVDDRIRERDRRPIRCISRLRVPRGRGNRRASRRYFLVLGLEEVGKGGENDERDD